MPPELTEPQLAGLRQVFGAEPAIGSVAIVRKQLQYFPKYPCFVIGVKLQLPWWSIRSTTDDQDLLQRILKQVRLPGNTFVFLDKRKNRGLSRKIFQVPGALVYTRQK